MSIDLYVKSQQLLEVLANSIHDRDLKAINPFCFNITDVHVAERWLTEFIKEVREDCVCV